MSYNHNLTLKKENKFIEPLLFQPLNDIRGAPCLKLQKIKNTQIMKKFNSIDKYFTSDNHNWYINHSKNFFNN